MLEQVKRARDENVRYIDQLISGVVNTPFIDSSLEESPVLFCQHSWF